MKKNNEKGGDNKLFVVIPCYNEEEVLEETTKRLKEKIERLILDKCISKQSRVVYVDDGSKDGTWEKIKEISKKNSFFTGIKLSRNRGHQNALLAGLLLSKRYADIIISMDADLQDDIDVIDKMIKKYNDGCEIIYGIRSSRKKDSFFKRFTAESFYKFMKFMGVEVIFNHADYRMMSKRAVEELEKYKEVNLFLRGIVPLIGLRTGEVFYERGERFAGKSKYPLKKMLGFAWDGITSFSIRPLRLICVLGFLILFISLFIMIYALIVKTMGTAVEGWAFIIISIWMIGGLQMGCIGIVGEYVGKAYYEAKRRPRFAVEENLYEEE